MKCPEECKSIWEKQKEETIIPTWVKRRPEGEGSCPRCGGKTVLRNGKFGKFYGCKSFPACKGSRNYDG